MPPVAMTLCDLQSYASSVFSWIIHSEGSQIPSQRDTQEGLWRNSRNKDFLPTAALTGYPCEQAPKETDLPGPVKPSEDCSLG